MLQPAAALKERAGVACGSAAKWRRRLGGWHAHTALPVATKFDSVVALHRRYEADDAVGESALGAHQLAVTQRAARCERCGQRGASDAGSGAVAAKGVFMAIPFGLIQARPSLGIHFVMGAQKVKRSVVQKKPGSGDGHSPAWAGLCPSKRTFVLLRISPFDPPALSCGAKVRPCPSGPDPATVWCRVRALDLGSRTATWRL